VLVVFWLLVILGAMDFDIISFDSEIDFTFDVDTDIEIPGFVGLLHTLGLTGVPFTIVLTSIIFLAWVFTYVIAAYVLPIVPTMLLKFLFGSAAIVGGFVLAVPITSKIVAPLRRLTFENKAKSNKDFLGSRCKVTSLSVDEAFGQGKILTTGTSLVARIRAISPNEIKKGDIVRPISFDEDENVYHVITDKEFEENLEK